MRGTYSFGGADARFGAGRAGHTHQGQDIAAAEGTPVVAPHAGTVKAVRYQASGAGHYVVLDGAGEERDYVFMHLATGTTLVREGQSGHHRPAAGAGGQHRPLVRRPPALRDLDRRRLVHRRQADRPAAAAARVGSRRLSPS